MRLPTPDEVWLAGGVATLSLISARFAWTVIMATIVTFVFLAPAWFEVMVALLVAILSGGGVAMMFIAGRARDDGGE